MQKKKAVEHTRKWRVTANVKRCVVGVGNKDNQRPMEVGRRRFTDRRPVHRPWRKHPEELLLECTHSKINRKG